MNELITIITFNYPHEAHLVKIKLESEGIEVFIKDELTVQVHNFYSNAIGGVKLQVKEKDFTRANQLLIESGYIKNEIQSKNRFFNRFDKSTVKLPIIGKMIFEIRLISAIMLLIIIITIIIALVSIPSKIEILSQNVWCVEKIYHNNQELNPKTIKTNSIFRDNICYEKIAFPGNRMISFPGINSNKYNCVWVYKNKNLVVRKCELENTIKENKSLENIIKEEEIKQSESIYEGTYSIKIRNKNIYLQSNSLTIIAKIVN